MGPVLWNLFYDDLLRLHFPPGVNLVCFADDLAVVVTAHNADLLEEVANPALAVVNRWMEANGLEIAPAKSEAVILTRKWAYRDPVFTINGLPIPVKKSIKYLGVQFDSRLNFTEHTKITTAATRRLTSALGRLMPNVGVPSARSRKLLISVMDSKLLYAASIWASVAAKTASNKEAMTQTQRTAAIRIIRGYRTVSDMAALFLAKMPPAYLMTEERVRIASARTALPASRLSSIVADERVIALQRWQVVWQTTTKAHWTRRILPNVP